MEYPKTYEYFKKFFQDLVNRGGEPYKSKLKPFRKKPFEQAEKISPPFYWLFNVKLSLTPYKVAWKRIAGEISGKAKFEACVIERYYDELLSEEKTPITDEKGIFIPVSSKEEAHYLTSILNSVIIRFYIASAVTEIHMAPFIVENIKIMPFNISNSLHLKLSKLSMRAHEIARQIYEEKREYLKDDLRLIEEEIDKIEVGDKPYDLILVGD